MADTSIVKSVRRVFEILELFERERRPMTAKQIASALGYPLTSTHALLKSMHALGYADYDATEWRYLPSQALPLVSEWVRDFLAHETRLLEFAESLNRETRETINLSRRTGLSVRIIHGYESTESVGVSVRVGTVMPLHRSLTGIAALAAMDAVQRDATHALLKDESPEEYAKVDNGLVTDVIAELEERGAALRCDVFVQGVGAICAPIRMTRSGETIVLGIVGPSERIASRESGLRQSLHRLTQRHDIQTVFPLRDA